MQSCRRDEYQPEQDSPPTNSSAIQEKLIDLGSKLLRRHESKRRALQIGAASYTGKLQYRESAEAAESPEFQLGSFYSPDFRLSIQRRSWQLQSSGQLNRTAVIRSIQI